MNLRLSQCRNKQNLHVGNVTTGDIDVVMGGPPCQGVSGLNRHSATEDILKDGRSGTLSYFSSHFVITTVLLHS